jgi:perosamine synthetase
MSSPIHNTFAPMAVRKQVRLAFWLQFMPWRWKNGSAHEELRNTLENHFKKRCGLFFSGRQALLSSLRALNIQPGDEVILQAFTCTVVPNAIIAIGAIPVYCDIDSTTLNINCEEVRKKITPATKAIICQNTFGIRANLKELRTICNEYNIALIEDCAHVITTSSEETDIGFTGDVLILSFGRDKAISGVCGGAALAIHPHVAEQIQAQEESAESISLWQISNILVYPLRYALAKKLWHIKLGLPYLKLLQLCKALPPIYTHKEREGIMKKTVQKLPNACAAMALQQWQNLAVFNAHRRQLSQIYQAVQIDNFTKLETIQLATAPQKFPVFIPNRDNVIQQLRQKNIHLQDGWSGSAINPPSCSSRDVFYRTGSCPVAEYCAAHIVSLPTHPTTTKKQAQRTIRVIHDILSHISQSTQLDS